MYCPRNLTRHYDSPETFSQTSAQPDAYEIAELFNKTFADSESTVLEFGEDEPVYYPARSVENPSRYHKIIFAHGFVNSALHEIAHWCIAGPERRQLTDYGYWYAPDGRSPEQQALFERVEVKPQAVEWHLAKACGVRFYLSFDNLDGAGHSPDQFKRNVCAQAVRYHADGLPVRAQRMKEVLLERYFNAGLVWKEAEFAPGCL